MDIGANGAYYELKEMIPCSIPVPAAGDCSWRRCAAAVSHARSRCHRPARRLRLARVLPHHRHPRGPVRRGLAGRGAAAFGDSANRRAFDEKRGYTLIRVGINGRIHQASKRLFPKLDLRLYRRFYISHGAHNKRRVREAAPYKRHTKAQHASFNRGRAANRAAPAALSASHYKAGS